MFHCSDDGLRGRVLLRGGFNYKKYGTNDSIAGDAAADGGGLDVRDRRCPSSRSGGSPASTPSRGAPSTDAAGLPSYRGDMVHGLEPTEEARRPDPGPARPRLRERGGRDEPGPRDHRRRAGGSAPAARVEYGFRAPLERRRALRAGRDRDRPQPAVHGRVRRRRQLAAHGRAVRESRDARARLRAFAVAARGRSAVPALGAPALDRRPHASARRRPRGPRGAHRQPDRRQDRSHDHARGGGRARRAARSRACRRPRDARVTDGQRRGPRRACRRSSTRSAGPVIAWCGSATRCTATPRSRRAVTRPGTSTASWTRSKGSSRSINGSVRIRAAFTSSTPARRSPSASVARR